MTDDNHEQSPQPESGPPAGKSDPAPQADTATPEMTATPVAKPDVSIPSPEFIVPAASLENPQPPPSDAISLFEPAQSEQAAEVVAQPVTSVEIPMEADVPPTNVVQQEERLSTTLIANPTQPDADTAISKEKVIDPAAAQFTEDPVGASESDSVEQAAAVETGEDEENPDEEVEDQHDVDASKTVEAKPSKSEEPKAACSKPMKISTEIPSQQDGGPLSDSSFDLLTQPFSNALASRFDKVSLVWGKDALAVTLDHFQARLKEQLQQAELRRIAAESNMKHSVATDEKCEKRAKPERKNKYKAVTKMYSDKPSQCQDEIISMIWGQHEERTIDLYFAWAQAHQSSELSHILERITNIEGVTAFIIFDIYEPERYPDDPDDQEDEFEEDENGFPVVKDPSLKMIDLKWEMPPHIIYTNTDLQTAKRIIPFTKQLVWRLVETTRNLDPQNDVKYLRLVSDVNEIVVMPMFPRHFLIAIQEPRAEPNKLFENLGLVTVHPKTVDDDKNAAAAKLAILHRTAHLTEKLATI